MDIFPNNKARRLISLNRIIAACGNDCAACPRYVKHPYEKTADELRYTAELVST